VATPGGTPAPAGDNLRRLTDLYRMMVRIRTFEDTALEAYKLGEIPGPLHVSFGQEATPAGVCANLRQDDRLTSNHRGHGHALAKGADPATMYLELYGREGGYCRGKGGSMHIADFSVGMLGANGVVAGGLPIAVGAAQGLKLLKSDAIAVCMFGDGATNRGPFLEALNWAAIYTLPVLFVCEDNGVAAHTETRTVTAGEGPAARANAIGVPAVTIDGNDAVAVDETVARLVADIRAGRGPRMVHAMTDRWSGHTATDAAGWRDPANVEAAKTRCPIARLKGVLIERGLAPALLDEISAVARAEMQDGRAAANAAPWPGIRSAFEDVQDAGAVAWR
jgi:acetoin:2,6-dichlorophenolindophenol oxidoreductase subunit alpha